MSTKVVSNLAAALALADNYKSPRAYLIAPLTTRTGQRRWMGLAPDGQSWVSISDPDFEPPLTDNGADDLPPLPPSPINLYAFAFVDDNGHPVRPYIEIAPAEENQAAAAAAATGQSTAPNTDGPALQQVLQLVKNKDAHAIEALKLAQSLIGTIGQAQLGVISEWRHLVGELREELKTAAATRDAAMLANSQLSQQLAEEREGGEMWRTVRELFSGKPEVLLEGLARLGKAVLTTVQKGE